MLSLGLNRLFRAKFQSLELVLEGLGRVTDYRDFMIVFDRLIKAQIHYKVIECLK
jgi:hypothetical protein